MLVTTKTSKKKIIIYTIIIILIIIANIVIYRRNNNQVNSILDSPELLSAEGENNLAAQDQINNIYQSVLEHKLFLVLEKIGDWPVVPENIGKADPFAPIKFEAD